MVFHDGATSGGSGEPTGKPTLTADVVGGGTRGTFFVGFDPPGYEVNEWHGEPRRGGGEVGEPLVGPGVTDATDVAERVSEKSRYEAV